MTTNIIELKFKPSWENFYKEETGYGIYSCKTDDIEKVMIHPKHKTFSIKGNTVQLSIDKEYSARLIEREDKKYGTYYEIVSIFEDIPSDPEEQRVYLSTIIKPKQVEAIFKAYPDEDIIGLIQRDELDITRIHGIGEKSYVNLKKRILDNVEFQQAFRMLSGYGLTNELIIKLVKHFSSSALLIKTIEEYPYQLTSVRGIGFKKADEIALSSGHNPNSKDRIFSAIEYSLDENAKEGHVYMTVTKLYSKLYDLTNCDTKLLNHYFNEVIDDQNSKVRCMDSKVSLKKHYNAELEIAQVLKILANEDSGLSFDPEEFIKQREKELNVTLTEQQKAFYHNVKKSRVSILTGFPGSGKSWSVQMLLNILESEGIMYTLLSPSAKAARVLSEYTHRKAHTIHKAIGYGMPPEQRDEVVIDEEFVIVDEVSMVDIMLMRDLLDKCVHPKFKIVFIGDIKQLLSVQNGMVLEDMINSGMIPTTNLDKVFRQKESGMLDIITKIRLEETFLNNNEWGIKEFGENCTVASVPHEKVIGGYEYFVKKYLKDYTSDEIIVATPRNVGNIGTIEINQSIQGIVNKRPDDEKGKGVGNAVFHIGDKIINTNNTYKYPDVNGLEVDIVNGDTGTIMEINHDQSEIVIDFGFATVGFSFDMVLQIRHAWASTIHSLQGDNAKVVIVIIDKAHTWQLNNSLIYVAASRATEKLIIIGQASAINKAIKTKSENTRNTYLCDFLKAYVNEEE